MVFLLGLLAAWLVLVIAGWLGPKVKKAPHYYVNGKKRYVQK